MPKTPKPKRTASQVKKSIWKLRSEITRRRDSDWRGQGRCIDCGKLVEDWKEGDAGHYISRVYDHTTPLLKDARNVNLQRKQCNMHPDGETMNNYRKALDRKYGAGTADELERLKHVEKYWKYSELEAYETELKQKIKSL